MNITDIRVSIADGLRGQGDYTPPRKAEVELKATVAEGHDANAALATLRAIAEGHVHAILNKTAAPAVTKPPVAGSGAPSSVSPSAQAAPPATGAINDKEKLAAQVVEAASPKRGRPPASVAPKAAQPTLESGPVKGAPTLENEQTADDLSSLLGDEPTPAPAAIITDKQLNDAVQKKNSELKKPQAIRGLVAEFVAPPKQMREIPQEQRANFLTKLEALT